MTTLYLIKVLSFYSNLVSTVFSIAGLVIILVQLNLDAKLFGVYRPNTIQNYINSFPTKKRVVWAAGNTSFSITAKARLTSKIPEDESLENKVDFLIKQVNNLQKDVDSKLTRINNLFSINVQETKSDIETASVDLRSLIANHAVGTYDFVLFGIVCALCGALIQAFM